MVIEVTSMEEFEQHLSNSKGKLVVVDFKASWCGPCKVIAPKYEALSKEAENANVVFLKVDVDEVSDVAERYNITAMPTFLFIKDGNKTDEVVGADITKLKEKIIRLRT